jgi:hypothetical protein
MGMVSPVRCRAEAIEAFKRAGADGLPARGGHASLALRKRQPRDRRGDGRGQRRKHDQVYWHRDTRWAFDDVDAPVGQFMLALKGDLALGKHTGQWPRAPAWPEITCPAVAPGTYGSVTPLSGRSGLLDRSMARRVATNMPRPVPARNTMKARICCSTDSTSARTPRNTQTA